MFLFCLIVVCFFFGFSCVIVFVVMIRLFFCSRRILKKLHQKVLRHDSIQVVRKLAIAKPCGNGCCCYIIILFNIEKCLSVGVVVCISTKERVIIFPSMMATIP